MSGVWTTSYSDPVEWVSNETVQTLDGIPGCNVKFDYRVARNRTIDVRYYITCPSPPTANGVDVAAPALMPSIERAPSTTVGVYGAVVGSGGLTLHFYTARLTEHTLTIFQSDDDSTTFEGSFFATVIAS